MLTRVQIQAIPACALALLIGTGAGQAQGPSDLRGGLRMGAYWPSGTPLYTLSEPVPGDAGAERWTAAAIEQGGVLFGVHGSLRASGWPVEIRLTLAQARGAEARTTSSIFRPCEEVCIPEPLPPASRAIYTSDLTITLVQLDAVTEPVGRLGPVTPQLLLGVAPRHHGYGPPRLEESFGSPEAASQPEVEFPGDALGLTLHFGSAVSGPVFGRELSVEFGDHVTMDARTLGAGGPADPFLRHDLYLAAGLALF